MKSNSRNNVTKTDKNNEPESVSTDGQKRMLSKRFLLVILSFGILIGAFFGIRWLHYCFTHASTDDARVKGDLITVSPTVQGKIRLLPIREGEHIFKGQLIAQLIEEDYQAQVNVAAGVVQAIESELKEAEADLILVRKKTQKGVQQAAAVLYASQAGLNEAKASMRFASMDFERISKLYKTRVVATSAMDKAQSAYDLAQARVALAEEEINENQAKLKVAEANIGEVYMKQQRIQSLSGRLEQVRAAHELARLKLEHTTVTSPIDGVVAKKVANLGEVIKPGQPVAVIVDLNNVWVEANLEETKVEHVSLGQDVDLNVDAYPKTRFSGKVINIGAAVISEFSLIPESRSAGNFTKVTQRIPIKIEVFDPAKQLRPGMMVVVGIDIRSRKEQPTRLCESGVKK